MSEAAYEWQHRRDYGCGIDEDPPWPNEDDEQVVEEEESEAAQ